MMIAVHHLVGAQEIARMLDVSRQRVQQLINHHSFPEPVVELAMGKIWSTEDVIAWAKGRGRAVRPLDQDADDTLTEGPQ